MKSDLPQLTKLLLLTLATYMNEHGAGCYPTVEQLTQDMSAGKRAVLTHIQIAKDRQWLVVKKHGFRGQRWANNEYEAVYPPNVEFVVISNNKKGDEQNDTNPKKVVHQVHHVDQKVVHVDQKVVHHVHTNSPINSPIDLYPDRIEPSLNSAVNFLEAKTTVSTLPDWMPLDAWEGYCKHRGKSFTDHAKELAIKKLDAFRNNGFNPREILENSIMNGWKGLFQPQSKVQTNAKVINSPAQYIPGHQQPDGKAYQAAAAVGRAIEILNDEFRDFDERNSGNKSRS